MNNYNNIMNSGCQKNCCADKEEMKCYKKEIKCCEKKSMCEGNNYGWKNNNYGWM